MSEFRSLVEGRLRELEGRVKPLIKQRDALKAQLDETIAEISSILPILMEVTKAAQAIGVEADNLFDDTDQTNSDDMQPNKTGITIKQAIRVVLNRNASGLNSGDILEQVNKEFWDGNLDRTSFSPQLSRMKRDGEVDLSEGIYTITQQGRSAGNLVRHRVRSGFPNSENEPSDVPASNGSEAGSCGHMSDRANRSTPRPDRR